ncbi:MAG: dihydropteroate synthase [Maritimibacter sp.]
MSWYYRPIPRGASSAPDLDHPQPLAGAKAVWFDQVHVQTGPGECETTMVAALSDRSLARLSAARPDLCGLTLDRPRIMGILNVTPDSFSDGGSFTNVTTALDHARAMVADADILDIGGESTRPGAEEVSVDEEIRRTAPVIRAIREAGITTPISIDTRKAAVAEAALDAGADIVNDVAAFSFDPELAALCAARDVPVCLMHHKGTPETMQDDPQYDDVLGEVLDFLTDRIEYAVEQGVKRERIITDPGIGFGKTQAHNIALLQNLSAFHDLGLPVLLGASRKRFIGAIGGAEAAQDRMAGSVAVALHGAAQGVQILRVHDTYETAQALRMFMALNSEGAR